MSFYFFSQLISEGMSQADVSTNVVANLPISYSVRGAMRVVSFTSCKMLKHFSVAPYSSSLFCASGPYGLSRSSSSFWGSNTPE